ncbi:ABC transporter ATP-binding protein/permease [Telmatospirillum sp.]|uniref:ABC transporter ATP-binding protein/permease n=1 Tax=Telmatospirillum sp. TaxID=2079197 RepID=UPI002845A887|nr:ABC transporter ATP-binding protein/permease [Telmatospirillum sp.]MDR3438390.1 ABC transporter ATP-binding protein/permease [Telmatospirillum sp.]
MTKKKAKSASIAAHPQEPFFRRFLELARGYWGGERKWTARLLTLSFVILTVGQVVEPVMFNLWSERLFDALEQHSMDRFLLVAAAIAAIIVFNIGVQLLHLRVKRRLQFGWRRWLSENMLDEWLTRGRHHQLSYVPGDHDNPDGRIAEDVRITTEYAMDLGHSLLYCLILLFSFTNILWMLSGSLDVALAGVSFQVPGYLLYVAILYAAVGTTVALLLGRPLVRAVNRRQGLEADYRFGLVRVREHAQAIALLHAEGEERRHLFSLLRGVRAGWYGQTRALSIVTIFSAGYSVLCAAFPLLISSPRYIAGAISLGILMQTAQAFQQTVAALSWPIDNLGRAAEWKASVERVLGLKDSLSRLNRDVEQGSQRILVEHSHRAQTLSFQDLAIDDVAGHPLIKRFSAEIFPGERVLIVGDPVAAVTLFRTVARVWPWGSGRIALPAHTRVFFMPQRPYLPQGPLRRALCYPTNAETLSDAVAIAALERVGLGYLTERLYESSAWEDTMALAQQQRIGFARLLIRRPDWIFLEDATDALDGAGEAEMRRLLEEEFPRATVLTIGSHERLEAYHARKFVLERTGDLVTLREVSTKFSGSEGISVSAG